MIVEEGWPCQGPLLRLAVDVAERLLPGWYLHVAITFLVILPGKLGCCSRCFYTGLTRHTCKVS